MSARHPSRLASVIRRLALPGWKAKECARAMGVDRATLSRYCSGLIEMPAARAAAFARAVGLSDEQHAELLLAGAYQIAPKLLQLHLDNLEVRAKKGDSCDWKIERLIENAKRLKDFSEDDETPPAGKPAIRRGQKPVVDTDTKDTIEFLSDLEDEDTDHLRR